MIKVTFNDDGFRIEGHANYAPIGYDIVCAGVSSLVGAFVSACKELNRAVDVNIDDGLVEVKFVDYDDYMYGIHAVVIHGLFNIAAEYPTHVTIIEGDTT